MAAVIDIHVHFGAPGHEGHADNYCYWSPSFEKTAAYWAFRLITGALTGKIDFDRAKTTMSAVVDSSTKVDKCVFLALDQVYDIIGDPKLQERTNLYTDNRAIVELSNGNPNILFGASIHPYRNDWRDELDYCLSNKAVLCKWIPSAQCIDPSHPKCIDLYDALAAHNLPLLCHVGPELSIPTWDKSYEKFNNAFYLRPALDRGVTVIFAHCSLPFEPTPLDDNEAFQQFLSVMDEAKSNGYCDKWKAYADISALCLLRSSYVSTLLSRVDAGRLLFGSDYPIPMIDFAHKNVPSIWDWISHFWQTLTNKNMLDKNYLLLKDMGFPLEVFASAGELFSKIIY